MIIYNTFHVPVLLRKAIDILKLHHSNRLEILDATFGGGGYSSTILKEFPHSTLHISDCDLSAIRKAQILKNQNPNRKIHVNHLKFSELGSLPVKLDAAIFDFGLCTDQIRDHSRGFSFRSEGLLDMRMDIDSDSHNAYDIVNYFSHKQLKQIIEKYGEDRNAGKIASAICNYRDIYGTINTTTELSSVIEKILPFRKSRFTYIHPATQTFQALRIFINDELNEIEKGLCHAISLLKPEGILIAISFHSLEDKIVKSLFDQWCHLRVSKQLTKECISPDSQEIQQNISCRSALMRAIQKL